MMVTVKKKALFKGHRGCLTSPAYLGHLGCCGTSSAQIYHGQGGRDAPGRKENIFALSRFSQLFAEVQGKLVD
ncbi:unnamed protein product [Gulo gulo]|uniref:Uncharacterized protein n=1 Tax=Gulo gulo TaxID=48420 RepID=A0A9X9M4N7_GULGU|nr:unnamed protein product [Gulo gulo]